MEVRGHALWPGQEQPKTANCELLRFQFCSGDSLIDTGQGLMKEVNNAVMDYSISLSVRSPFGLYGPRGSKRDGRCRSVPRTRVR